MPKLCDTINCSGCHACYSICPTKSVIMAASTEGFLYPEINTETCVECGLCESVCPLLNKKEIIKTETTAFAARSTETSFLDSSSSGGIFFHIAKSFIENGGVVFGAAFDANFKVIHKSVSETEDIIELQGSKYVQSEIGDTYREAKKLLDFGTPVLFTGTPCQIEGLYFYLNKDYDNLYTQDLICHGVPSPKIWDIYLKYRESKADSKAKKIFFRDKRFGWEKFSLLLSFSNNTEYSKVLFDDSYLRGFVANLYLRTSCHNCNAKGINRRADITLADFWGIGNVVPDMYNEKGTSLILVHSKKGERLIGSISNCATLVSCDVSEAVKYNSAAVESVQPHKERNEFFNKVNAENFDELIQRLLKRNLVDKIKQKIKYATIKLIKIFK